MQNTKQTCKTQNGHATEHKTDMKIQNRRAKHKTDIQNTTQICKNDTNM